MPETKAKTKNSQSTREGSADIPFLVGKKRGMTQIFTEDGKRHGVTVVEAEPMAVTQIKTQDRDGYQALQLGVGESSGKNLSDAEKGHHEKAGGDSYFEKLVEFRVGDPERFALGQKVAISFSPGDTVSVTGVSKGKGFQGVVKRHGFAGGRRTHGGQKSAERGPGSIGATGPSHVRKGTKMAGRLGTDKTTVKNLEVVHTEPEDNELYIKGGLPGTDGSWLQITK